MRIAVSATFLENNYPEVYEYAQECIYRIATEQKEHAFVFVTDKPVEKRLSSLKNVSFVQVKPTNRLLRRQFWYYYRLPVILKKQKIDLLVNANGVCSLGTSLPQLCIMHDLAFIQHPQHIAKAQLRFSKKYTGKFLRAAKGVIVFAEHARQQLIETFNVDKEIITITPYGVNPAYQPIDYAVKEAVKEQYAEGKEYFLFTGMVDPTKNILHLLKAFSFFKKRQKSNMQLLIVAPHATSLEESLKTYKYRSEVKLLTGLNEMEKAKIMAAAYAFVYPVWEENTGAGVLQAMQCRVPIVASSINILHELCDKAAIYTFPDATDNIADKMMLIFKDENQRNELIAHTATRAAQYDWDKTADLLWSAINKAVE